MGPRCKHFNGIQHLTCLAGVKYSSIISKEILKGKARIPCLNVSLENCPKRQMQTLQEVEEEIQAFAKASDEFALKLYSNICTFCGKSLEPRTLVGRCYYGTCGHRIGQGL